MNYLKTEMQGDIALIGLNRPEKRNAISDAFIEELETAVIAAEAHAKAGVIHGFGPHFCAGLDLAEHVKKTPFEGVKGSRRWHRVFERIQRGNIRLDGVQLGEQLGQPALRFLPLAEVFGLLVRRAGVEEDVLFVPAVAA